MRKPAIVTVSDVVLGYGSPQIAAFTASLARLTKASARIFQPFVPGRLPNLRWSEGSEIISIWTADHPYADSGRTEYLRRCAEEINLTRPDVLIICNYNLIEIVGTINYTPKKIVHLALEDLASYTSNYSDVTRMHHVYSNCNKIDWWIFPESDRAATDAGTLSISHEKIMLLYNVSNGKSISGRTNSRTGRIIYAGTIDVETSVGAVIFDQEFGGFPIDVFGDLQGDNRSKQEMTEKINRLQANKSALKWHGQTTAKSLNDRLGGYQYSIVYWRPVRDALLHAAPNKFFQAIAAGVPPITAPHPQCRALVERYGCGIVLKGWEKQHLYEGIEQALHQIGTPLFDHLVDNCRTAYSAELNWDAQFNKFARISNAANW